VGGVLRAPFSGPNSLLTGKNTGKLKDSAPKPADTLLNVSELRLFAQSPAQFKRRTQQGIITRLSGNNISLILACQSLSPTARVSIYQGLAEVNRSFPQCNATRLLLLACLWSKIKIK
jgi:hypothetical protein